MRYWGIILRYKSTLEHRRTKRTKNEFPMVVLVIYITLKKIKISVQRPLKQKIIKTVLAYFCPFYFICYFSSNLINFIRSARVVRYRLIYFLIYIFFLILGTGIMRPYGWGDMEESMVMNWPYLNVKFSAISRSALSVWWRYHLFSGLQGKSRMQREHKFGF